MNERLFRFDTIVAVCALLISCVAAIASVYQTRVFRDQYAATIWPYVNVDDTTNLSGSGPTAKISSLAVTFTNNGLGPALIRGAQLSIDGRRVSTWNELRNLIAAAAMEYSGKKIERAQMASIDASTTIRPGDARQVFAIGLKEGIPIARLLGHDPTIDLCYCSLNDKCWTLHYRIARANKSFPRPAARCDVNESIGSQTD